MQRNRASTLSVEIVYNAAQNVRRIAFERACNRRMTYRVIQGFKVTDVQCYFSFELHFSFSFYKFFFQSFLFLYYFSIFWNNYFSFYQFLYQSILFLY